MDLPLVDAYGHLEDDPAALDSAIATAKTYLQGEQLRAVDGLRSIPGGIQIVQSGRSSSTCVRDPHHQWLIERHR
jgi:hypothetical protein